MRERIFHKILNTRRKIVANAAVKGSLKMEFRFSGCLPLQMCYLGGSAIEHSSSIIIEQLPY